MLKWIGVFLLGLTLLWMVLQKETIGFSSTLAGVAMGSALFVVLCPTKVKELLPKPDDGVKKIAEIERRALETIEGMKFELQKTEQRAQRSEERCLSYQRLVDVHQNEIEKLRGEIQTLGDLLVQKEKKLGELHFARSEPDLFD